MWELIGFTDDDGIAPPLRKVASDETEFREPVRSQTEFGIEVASLSRTLVPFFADLGAEVYEGLVVFGGVGVGLVCEVAASGEVDLVVLGGLGGEAAGTAHVAHGVAAAADVAGVRLAAMHETGVVEAGVVGLQFAGDGPGFIALGFGDLDREDVAGGIDGIVVGKSFLRFTVGAGDHVHAAVDAGGGIDGEPDGDDLHGIDHGFPIGGILVPWDAAAVALGLADEVAGEEGDVGAGEGLDEVEDFVGEEPGEKVGIREVGDVHCFRADVGRERGEFCIEVSFETREFFSGENRVGVDEVALVVEGVDLGFVEARGGGVHGKLKKLKA